MTTVTRLCEVCGSADRDLIFENRWQGAAGLEGYDVVVCGQCGFAYADRAPDRETLAKACANGPATPAESKRTESTFEALRPLLKPGMRVLDVGCGCGELMRKVHALGGIEVHGIEPCWSAVKAGPWEGCDATCNVHVNSLFEWEMPEPGTKGELGQFDLVILSHVLEHVAELNRFLTIVRRLVKPGGLVFVEVPDIWGFAIGLSERRGWTNELDLFAQLGPEHINFFEQYSLEDLFLQNGFKRVGHRSVTSIMQVVQSVYRRYTMVADKGASYDLARYVSMCTEELGSVRQRIAELAKTQTPLYVWGAGLHTKRLLATTDLGQCNIQSYYDSDPSRQAGFRSNLCTKVGWIREHPDVSILISSRRSQAAIHQQIQDAGLQNPVVLLYPELEETSNAISEDR